MKNNIKVGIEIECLGNVSKEDVFNFRVGQYREGIKILKLGWLAERDSSISISRRINFTAQTFELISPTVRGRKEFFDEINKFIKYFSKDGKYNLKEVLYFNKSCGSHIHISIFKKPGQFTKFTDKNSFIKTRNKFITEIKNSNFPEKIKRQILGNYNRTFAKQGWEEYTRQDVKYERNYEFNFYSEHSGKGIEWRAINMCGIETWEQFKDFWKIVYDCIENLVSSMKKWKQNETYNIDMKDYEKYFKPIKEEIEIEDRDEFESGEDTFSRMAYEAMEETAERNRIRFRGNVASSPVFISED